MSTVWLRLPRGLFIHWRALAERELPPEHRAALCPPESLPEEARWWGQVNGRAGFGVTTEGRLVSAYGLGMGAEITRAALLRGAHSLDCFKGPVSAAWENHGWGIVGETPFDPALAPPEWGSLPPRPVVEMVHVRAN